ncbi:hypothetical protein LCGC14_1527390 [marine sediment metagenome]|uniref:Uncharacterized protein n=1 Tax=marine sediment metagenome TaxID=412755 RepID=A0A0F9LCG0_9ZZZZ
MTDRENRDKNINFRLAEKLYEDTLELIKNTNESISALMRHILYDYLRFKKVIKEAENNGG